MNTAIKNVFIFTAGAVIGGIVSANILKNKYETIANEEIASIKEAYFKKKSEIESEATLEEEEEEETESTECHDEEEVVTKEDYKKLLEDCEYIVKEENYEEMDNPRLIDPYDFGSEYETISLTYYADGVLEDDLSGQILKDKDLLKDLVCADYAEHFGDYEADTVFLRNDETMRDIEICRDNRKYSDLTFEDIS